MSFKDKLKSENAIFSLRIVSIDNYMTAPLFGLDTCYSEFRGNEIKQVPVIRIFGTDGHGIKTCAHIHGIFPYFYVPYAGDSTANDADRLAYQLSSSLDKAINISLGQANSTTQHIFKIVVVKGLPFYGYHQNEHKYMKIFLYNPQFVRRAANLLQNGAILSQIFQPHESHVPYILQFMIDYNLYGMSFLHVPNKMVRYRQRNNRFKHSNLKNHSSTDDVDRDILKTVDSNQILDEKIERISTSKQEIDLESSFILNRLQINTNDDLSEYANPGIAFLWRDERSRRSQLSGEVPPLAVTQETATSRGTIPPTESEIFHKNALNNHIQYLNRNAEKTSVSESISNESQITTSLSDHSRKFNLNNFLKNAVYPAEYSPNESILDSSATILDASHIVDHLRSFKQTNSSHTIETLSTTNQSANNLNFDADETIVDEELVLSLTQKFSNTTLLNETLDQEEHEVLDILEVLDEQDEQKYIDDDSVLAPLSQVRESSQKCEQNNATESFDAEDSDDDLLNEFSMSILDCVPEELSTINRDEFKIPQLDGACDSPRKNSTKKVGPKSSGLMSPSRSNKKYTPLNVVVTRSPSVKINCKADGEGKSSRGLPVKIPTLCIEKYDSKPSTSSNSNSSSINPIDNIQTAIKRESEVVQSSGAIRSLFQMPDEHKKIIENSPTVILTRYEEANSSILPQENNVSKESLPSFSGNDNEIKCEQELTETNETDDTKRRYPKRDRKPRIAFKIGNPIAADNEKKSKTKHKQTKDGDESDDLEKMDFWYSWYEWSDCKISKQYDRERNFFPQPGPSTLNYYEDEDLTGYYKPVVKETPTNSRSRKRNTATGSASNHKPKKYKSTIKDFVANDSLSPPSSDNSDWENGVDVQSFYEQSFALQNSATKCSRSPDVGESSIPNSSPPQNMDENSDSNNTTISTPMMAKILKNVLDTSTVEKPRKLAKGNNLVTIRPAEKPSNHNETVRTMSTHNIPGAVHPVPFYSDPNDVIGTRKEIGNTILQLRGDSVKDCEEFHGQISVTGIHKWQQLVATSSTSRNLRSVNNKSKTLDDDINAVRKILTKDNKIIKIKPTSRAPKFKDTKKWLEHLLSSAKKKNSSSSIDSDTENQHQMEVDSPVKDRREKATTVLHDSDDDCKIIDDNLGLNGYNSKFQKDDHVTRLLHNKNITLSVVSKSGKKESVLSRTSDDDSDDVICLDDNQLTVKTNGKHVSMSKTQFDKNLEQSAFIAYLNLDDTINKMNSQNISFGIKGAILDNSCGFRMNLENFQCAKLVNDHNHLTIMSLEIHCQTRLALRPDPNHDEITCIFYAIHNDVPADHQNPRNISGVLVNTNIENNSHHHRHGIPHIHIKYFPNEKELLLDLVRLVHLWDPDIFAGYEIELASWGYIIQRSQTINMEIVPLISRIPSQKTAKIQFAEQENVQIEEFHGIEYDSEYKLHGRILLDVWRLLRGEIALSSYSFESIMYHVLHRRFPKFSFEKLTRLWNTPLHQWIVIEYYMNRTIGTLEIMNQLDLVGRTCELAKLFGIQFYEVLSRGSQFRVESMMLRIAKPKNLIPVSPSVQQRAYMRAPEYLPLILEPHSRFYADPLIVLDFQSLYPSMIIAYNYCFSTCLGRVEHLGPSQPFEFGASQLRVPRRLIEQLMKRNSIHISPCGAVFVKSSVREGVLPRMLREIIDTRLMVKQSMKLHKTDKLLQRILHSRQLGLKLMANVTYGYTAANFSGRMPCVEVGDSVVSKGRETLERAIKIVESNEEWGCRVVYGDTDSMFVLVPGRSREEAFRIGSEIAKTVTQQNPFPVCLKLEKVYQPSILQTKKRYVGFMYESAEQSAPIYEAKGIETVRRDGCPAVAKMLEKTLRIIFETCDISAVKRYVCRQFTKILAGRANIQDLIFAKEFRGIRGYKPGACVPALELTRIALKTDPRSEPRRGERVPYLVIHGPPGLPLIRLVRRPHEYLSNEALKINAMYYITKVLIPPLNRCLLLIGADAHQWFADLPRKSQYLLSLDIVSNVMTKNDDHSNINHLFKNDSNAVAASKKSTISQYFSSTNCVCGCGKHTHNGICSSCLQPNRRQQSTLFLADKCMQLERKLLLCQDICKSCCGHTIDTECNSLDCSVLFVLNQWTRESKQIHFYRQLIDKHF